jgi:malonate decarboxylase gamma subunit
MDWKTLATTLFGADHGIAQDGDFLQGTVSFEDEPVTVIGTTGHAPIGVRMALAQARVVLDTVARHPGRSILLLIDTQGQQLRRRDELLGINRAMAHLGMTIDFARRAASRAGLVYDQALVGGFITSAHRRCLRRAPGRDRVMRIPAMARVTKLPEEVAALSPTLCLRRAWTTTLQGGASLAKKRLARGTVGCVRASAGGRPACADGLARGGRRLAATVVQLLEAA